MNPIVWNAIQAVFGAPDFKRNLYRSVLHAPGRILDFGCATGHVADAFSEFDYYGIDLDAKSIATAQAKFAGRKNMHFLAADIKDRPYESAFFDAIMFASVVHHLSDDVFVDALRNCHDCLKPSGSLHILDPVFQDGDAWYQRMMRRIDRGRFPRTAERLCELVSIAGLFDMQPGTYHVPYGALIKDCAFIHLELRPKPQPDVREPEVTAVSAHS